MASARAARVHNALLAAAVLARRAAWDTAIEVGKLAGEPSIQVASASAATAAVVFGTIGGVVGTVACGTVGAIAGLIPAIFTFGLSIPVGAAVGGTAGAVVGTAVGSSAGFVGGGVSGYAAYQKRQHISQWLAHAADRFSQYHASVRKAATTAAAATAAKASDLRQVFAQCVGHAREVARQGEARARQLAATPEFQVTAATAVGGAALLGTSGSGIGLAAGGLFGAAVGTVPAVFTFGLSIPIGAAIGGGVGLCIGAVSGTCAGLVGGGAMGYSAYSHRDFLSKVSAAGGSWIVVQSPFGSFEQGEPAEDECLALR